MSHSTTETDTPIKITLSNTFGRFEFTSKEVIPPYFRLMLNNLSVYDSIWNKHTKQYESKVVKQFYAQTGPCTFMIPYAAAIMMMREMRIKLANVKEMVSLEIENHDSEKIVPLDATWNPDIKPFDYQKAYVQALLELNEKKPTMLLTLQTGKGKSLIGSYFIHKKNHTAAIIVLPRYVDKWKDDVKKYLQLRDEEICTLVGGKSILQLIDRYRRKRFPRYKILIFSMRTLMLFYGKFQEYADKLPFKYEDFFEYLGVGTVLSDETHQEFHNVVKFIVSHKIPTVLGLTATMHSLDHPEYGPAMKCIFPADSRPKPVIALDQFIDVIHYFYTLKDPSIVNAAFRNLNTQNNINGNIVDNVVKAYNHMAYEQLLMSRENRLNTYFRLVYGLLEAYYLDVKLDGEKCLIFFSTVDMCRAFTELLENKHLGLKVAKYTQEDPYDNLYDSDILVSTILSSGTAIDIPNLITVIQTNPVKSEIANKQALGRLRKIEDKKLVFVSVLSTNPVHKAVYDIREKQFESLVKSQALVTNSNDLV